MNSEHDSVWQAIYSEATTQAAQEPILASYLHAAVLSHESLDHALSFQLASKLQNQTLPALMLREVMAEAYADDPGMVMSARRDINAICERDPATHSMLIPLLYLKGLHALESYRVAHWLWKNNRQTLARNFQNRISEAFAVDIHPAAKLGQGIMIDHGTGVVVGETAVIDDNVSMLHEVTLGGTGKTTGDRHPKIRCGVLIGAGAKILGNVTVGVGAKVGAGSVVLDDVPDHCTVAGIPAKVVGCPESDSPALDMNHQLPCSENEA